MPIELVRSPEGILTAKEGWAVPKNQATKEEKWLNEVTRPEREEREQQREIEKYFRRIVDSYERRVAEITNHARRLGEQALLLQRQVEEKAQAEAKAEEVATQTEAEFRALADRWLSETNYLSDPIKKFMHPSHLKIIGMGRRVLPLVLREVEKKTGHWFVALDAISPVNPVRPEDETSYQRVADAWIRWGKAEGLI